MLGHATAAIADHHNLRGPLAGALVVRHGCGPSLYPSRQGIYCERGQLAENERPFEVRDGTPVIRSGAAQAVHAFFSIRTASANRAVGARR